MLNLGYVILYVGDVEAAVGFLRDVLGLRHRFTRDGYAEFGTGAAKLGLLEEERAADLIRGTPSGGGGSEILFLVDDVDREAKRLREAGARILSGPQDRPWGHRTLHLEGPEGHIVELAQEIPRQEPMPDPNG